MEELKCTKDEGEGYQTDDVRAGGLPAAKSRINYASSGDGSIEYGVRIVTRV